MRRLSKRRDHSPEFGDDGSRERLRAEAEEKELAKILPRLEFNRGAEHSRIATLRGGSEKEEGDRGKGPFLCFYLFQPVCMNKLVMNYFTSTRSRLFAMSFHIIRWPQSSAELQEETQCTPDRLRAFHSRGA